MTVTNTRKGNNMTDKPGNVLSLKGLDLEGNNEPVLVPIPTGNGVITFPDFTDGDVERVEEMFGLINQGLATGVLTPLVKKWLPAKEYDKFLKAYPKFKAQTGIIGAVLEALQKNIGDEGEGVASES